MSVQRTEQFETVRLFGQTSTWAADEASVKALLFGHLANRAQPVVEHYRSDLYHDAMWLHEQVSGPTSFEWSCRQSGTHIGTDLRDVVKGNTGDDTVAMWAVRLFIGRLDMYCATFARLDVAVEVKRTADGAREAGLSNGWGAANYAEAYGTDESPDAEAWRRSIEQVSYDRHEWVAGFLEGWQLCDNGCWQDGSPRDED